VLISSWNGAKYIEDQLNSIYSQQFAGDIHVVVRDDGSCDGTVSILKKFECHGIRIVAGDNIGVKASFFELIKMARDFNCDYYALADQDDVWLPGKIQRAISQIGSDPVPLLYCSSLFLVDDNLQYIGKSIDRSHKSFASALIRNFATGCSCVFNRKLLDCITIPLDTEMVAMHDWWIALHAMAFGRICYDFDSYVLYRQHSSNQIGMKIGISGFLDRFNKYMNSGTISSRFGQALHFKKENLTRLPNNILKILNSFSDCDTGAIRRIYFIFRFRPVLQLSSILRFLIKL